MPEVDEYLRLKEMEALLSQARRATAALDEELNRLKRREGEMADRRAELNTLLNENKDLTHKIAELDRQLAQRLSEESKQKLEDEGLTILIRQQELDEKITEHRQFLSGFEKTLEEIRDEVNTAISEHRRVREEAVKRAHMIQAELPPDWQKAFQRIAAKNPAHGPFSRIENGHCYFCRSAISRPFESEVEAQLLLKACPSCDRLFLPHKAVYG